jgi:hypothetical protein
LLGGRSRLRRDDRSETPQLLPQVRGTVALWRKGDMLDGCGSIGAGVVALFASVALGWRFEAALGVVVVELRVRRVVEPA